MIVPLRVQRSPPLISYPITPELASVASSSLLVSPPNTPPRGHKHSLSKPMTWLGRSTSSTSTHSAPQAAPKPIRISEPKFDTSLDIFNVRRGGALGSGATVVRTPQEALACTGQLLGDAREDMEVHTDTILEELEEDESRGLPPLPDSPPLPSLPPIGLPGPSNNPSVPSHSLQVSLPHAAPPPFPPSTSANYRTSNLRSSSSSDPVPVLPVHLASTPPQTPFQAILLSSTPDHAIDPTRIVVALETCSMTYRTTLKSLTSRPSYLSDYIMSLLRAESETASVYSHASDVSIVQQNNNFNSIFHDHLTSSGCLSRSSSSIHIFLDRPSAPYTHVLSYLRSLPGTREHPEVLPLGVQLSSSSRSRLETLLELRDEASYLGLSALHKLCCDEIKQRHSVLDMTLPRCASGSSGASIHSLRTVIEPVQSDQDVRLSGNAGSAAESQSGLASPKIPRPSLRQRSTSGTRNNTRTIPPVGWI